MSVARARRAIALALCVAASACNAILGNEDRVLDTADAAAGDDATLDQAAEAEPSDAARDVAADTTPDGGEAGDAGSDASGDAASGDDAAGDAAADSDAAVTCASPFVCTAAAPAGWDGPLALYEGAAPAPACPPDSFARDTYDGNHDLVAPPATCSACSCSTPRGMACSATTNLYNGAACTNGCGAWTLAPNLCTDIKPYFPGCTAVTPSVLVGNPQGIGGTCVASGGTASVTPASWTGPARACATAAPPMQASCNAGDVCVPAPGAPFLPRWCVEQAGDVPCPGAPYLEKHVEYASFMDTRGCTACGCDPPTGAACNGTVFVFSSSVCGGGAAAGFATNNMCGGAAPIFSTDYYYDYEVGVVTGACPTRGGQPKGGATPGQPTTFCCQGSALDAGTDAPSDADAGVYHDPSNVSPSTLELWLSADRGVTCDATLKRVTTWADRSSHGRDATAGTHEGPQCQRGHTLNSVDLPYFSRPAGTPPYLDETLDVDLSFLNNKVGYTIFVVERRLGDPATGYQTAAMIGTQLPNEAAWNRCGGTGLNENNQATALEYARRADQVMTIQFDTVCGGGAGVVFPAPGMQDGGAAPPAWFDTHRFTGAPANIGHELWVNGVHVATSGPTAPLTNAPAGGGIGRGVVTTIDDSRFNGDIAEVIVYSSALSETDRGYIENYLQDHWAL